jgi:hypothetical protein
MEEGPAAPIIKVGHLELELEHRTNSKRRRSISSFS